MTVAGFSLVFLLVKVMVVAVVDITLVTLQTQVVALLHQFETVDVMAINTCWNVGVAFTYQCRTMNTIFILVIDGTMTLCTCVRDRNPG